MREIVSFLQDAGAFFLATDDGGQPRVRPFGSVMEFEGKLFFCTENTKAVYRQLAANPKCEICALKGEEWLRLCGKAVFVDDKAAKEAMFVADSALDAIYGTPENPEYVVFYLDGLTALLYPEEGEPTKLL